MKKPRIAPSESMEQALMNGLVSDVNPLGGAARRGAQLTLQEGLEQAQKRSWPITKRTFRRLLNV